MLFANIFYPYDFSDSGNRHGLKSKTLPLSVTIFDSVLNVRLSVGDH